MTVFTERDIAVLHSTALSMSQALHPSHPAVLDIYRKLADAHHARGTYDEAIAMYFHILNLLCVDAAGLEIHPSSGNVNGPPYRLPPLPECATPDEIRRYADTLGKIGDVHSARGNYDDAIAVYNHNLGLYVESLGDDHPFVGRIRRNLGILLHQTRRDVEADDMLERALLTFRRARRVAANTAEYTCHDDGDRADASYQSQRSTWDADVLDRDAALTHRTMGGVAEERGDLALAVKSYAACAEVYVGAFRRRRPRRSLAADAAELAEVHRVMAVCHSTGGDTDEAIRRLQAAIGAYRLALEAEDTNAAAEGGEERVVSGNESSAANFTWKISENNFEKARNSNSNSNSRMHSATTKREHPRNTLDRDIQTVDNSFIPAPVTLGPHQVLIYQRMAEVYGMLSSVFGSKMLYKEAQDYNSRALNLYRATNGEISPEVARTHQAIAEIYDKKDKHELAMHYYRASLESRRWYRPDGGGRWLAFVKNDANINVPPSPSTDENCTAANDDTLLDDLPEIATTLINIAALHSLDGRSDLALNCTEEALAARRRCFSDHHPTIAGTLNSIGILRCRTNDLSGALVAYWELLQIRRVVHGCAHTKVSETLKTIGKVLEQKGDYAEAADVFTEALTIYEYNQNSSTAVGSPRRKQKSSPDSPKDVGNFPFSENPVSQCCIHKDPLDLRCPLCIQTSPCKSVASPAPLHPSPCLPTAGATPHISSPGLWDGGPHLSAPGCDGTCCYSYVLDDVRTMSLMRLVVNLKRSVKDCVHGSCCMVLELLMNLKQSTGSVLREGSMETIAEKCGKSHFRALGVRSDAMCGAFFDADIDEQLNESRDLAVQKSESSLNISLSLS